MTKEEQVWDEFMGAGDFNSLSTQNKSLVKNILSAYAKQQAIAFFKFCLPGPSDFEPHISKRYEKFIEQQNKQ